MKKIIYVVRTDMSFLNMLGKFGCMNWKVALRKEISALSVLEVWFVLFILYTLNCLIWFITFLWNFCIVNTSLQVYHGPLCEYRTLTPER
jgi:membrane protein YdbS with pleckstrin-like domain